MIKKVVFSASIIMLSVVSCFARTVQDKTPKISNIIIDGTINIKPKTIKSELKSKVGKPYSEEIVKNDIQNILGMGNFENVEVNMDTTTMKLTFVVKEKPYIQKINFKGNKVFSYRRLKEEAVLKEKDFYDLAKLEESKSKILTLYKDKGYADVKLEFFPTIDTITNQMIMSCIVTEGNKILIGGVECDGVKAYKTKKILKLMKTKKKKVFKQETLKDDIVEIEKFYKNNGYIDVKAGEPVITYNDERTQMFIKMVIEEGVKYKIGQITFSGFTVYSENEIKKALTIKTGTIYNDEKLQESRQAVNELYSDKGYLHCQVVPEFKPDNENGLMDIDFSITEGKIVYVGNIFVDGLVSTNENVITREIQLKPSDVFSASKVRRSIEKIYNLGFIDAVEPEIQPTNKPDVMDLVLNVTEGKPGMLTAGAGYSSVDYLMGTLSVQHINLFRRAQRLNLSWEFGARRQNYEINWTEPWFLDKPMSLGAGIFDTQRTMGYGTDSSYYKQGRRGGSVTVGPRLSDKLSLLFSYTYENIRLFDINPDTTSVNYQSAKANNIVDSDEITCSILSQIVWDSRDNIFDASRGNKQALSVQLSGTKFLGGDVNIVKPIFKSSWYFPTFWKFVLSVNATVGYVEYFKPSEYVPVYERFNLGGADSVRGYDYREIGVLEGGQIMQVYNIEYKFPLVQEKKRTILQFAIFADCGGSWNKYEDICYSLGDNTNYFKAGFGCGIRFTTPVFPLRLDWGYGLNHKPGDELQKFYFTIGNMF